MLSVGMCELYRAPDTAKTKPKMLHSSSLHGLQKALQCESVPVLQCNDLDDIDLETVTKLYVGYTIPHLLLCCGCFLLSLFVSSYSACKHQRD